MARSANCMPRLLLYGLMPGCASVCHHTPGAHRYCDGVRSVTSAEIDQAGACPVGASGWFSRHNGTRSAGGLMIEQSANDMVRDHRKIPVLLVMLNCPVSLSNQLMYTTSGIANAVTHATTTRQPTRRSSRNARITRKTGAPLPLITDAHETSSPTMTASQMAGLRLISRIPTAIISTSVNSVSGRMEDSSQICRESNRVGADASTAPQAGSPRTRSTP